MTISDLQRSGKYRLTKCETDHDWEWRYVTVMLWRDVKLHCTVMLWRDVWWHPKPLLWNCKDRKKKSHQSTLHVYLMKLDDLKPGLSSEFQITALCDCHTRSTKRLVNGYYNTKLTQQNYFNLNLASTVLYFCLLMKCPIKLTIFFL